ncbi:TetR/AcrR family transcriptional regulator [Parahaliea aestuarii]|uniref:TetR/AcrR family transcriptional regulator n=1 Tax=Parahaliea aestuarii TaxID=1852021 RepID=A0A5C8ZXE4_9GAMM|nr:TetR/AcrR family transcriptional regulator [Parahaliea aestuarii]
MPAAWDTLVTLHSGIRLVASSTADSAPYHHGDLYKSLIVAAAELIEEDGLMGFSMVAAARRLGVSSAAPYRHFRDRSDLLNAVTDLAFYALNTEVEAAAALYEPGTEDCLVALGMTYLDFLQRHQPFYELMWGSLEAELTTPECFARRVRGLHSFIAALADWCRIHHIQHRSPEDIALAFWSMAHGLSLLQNHRAFTEVRRENRIEDMLRTNALIYLRGVLAEAGETGA